MLILIVSYLAVEALCCTDGDRDVCIEQKQDHGDVLFMVRFGVCPTFHDARCERRSPLPILDRSASLIFDLHVHDRVRENTIYGMFPCQNLHLACDSQSGRSNISCPCGQSDKQQQEPFQPLLRRLVSFSNSTVISQLPSLSLQEHGARGYRVHAGTARSIPLFAHVYARRSPMMM